MWCEMRSALFSTTQTNRRQYFPVTVTEPVLLWPIVEASLNVMAHAHKPDFEFRRNGRVHLNRRGRQFSRLLAAEVCASAVLMLDTPRSEVVLRVLATHSIRQFPLHYPSRASPCAITFQLESNNYSQVQSLLAPTVCWGRIHKCYPLWDSG